MKIRFGKLLRKWRTYISKSKQPNKKKNLFFKRTKGKSSDKQRKKTLNIPPQPKLSKKTVHYALLFNNIDNKEIPALIDENQEISNELTNRDHTEESKSKSPKRESSFNDLDILKENKIKLPYKPKHRMKTFKKNILKDNVGSNKSIKSLRNSLKKKIRAASSFKHKSDLLHSLRELKRTNRSSFTPSKVSERESVSEINDNSSKIVVLKQKRPKSAFKMRGPYANDLKFSIKPDIEKFIKESSSIVQFRSSFCSTPQYISKFSGFRDHSQKIRKDRPKSECIKDIQPQCKFAVPSEEPRKLQVSSNLFSKLNKFNSKSTNEKSKIAKSLLICPSKNKIETSEKYLNASLSNHLKLSTINKRYKYNKHKCLEINTPIVTSVEYLYEKSKLKIMNSCCKFSTQTNNILTGKNKYKVNVKFKR